MNSDQNLDARLCNFTDIFGDEIENSQPISLSPVTHSDYTCNVNYNDNTLDRSEINRPAKGTGQRGDFHSIEEIDRKYRSVFSYPLFNYVQSKIIDDALYSDASLVVSAPTGSGKTVVFEMAIVQLLMELDDAGYAGDFKIIYMAPVKAVCTERLTEWYPKFTPLGLLCIEVTGDTDVDFHQLKAYRIIITTPEKWDMLTRRWTEHRSLVEVTRLLLIDEVHILNDQARGPVLEAVVSRMKAIESSSQSAYRLEQLQRQRDGRGPTGARPPRVRLVAVSATVSNPEDVAAWLGTPERPAVYHKYGDECRPVKLHRVVEGYPCAEGTSIFKFDIILNYRLWPLIQKYYNGKPTLIFCNTRKSVILTAETLSKELTVSFSPELQARLNSLAAVIKNKKIQSLILCGVGCHHAGLLYEERVNIEQAFRNKVLPILITTTTLAMGVNLPAHLVIIKNTQQYINGSYQEYSISTVLQMVGRAGRPQYDSEATAVIMTRMQDKPRYQALVGGHEPLQSYLHKRLAENLNSEVALGTVTDVAQCVHWLRSTFLYTRAAKDPRRYLGLPSAAAPHLISKKIEELCVKAMNGLASAGLINMDEASCIESTEAGRLMSVYYLDFETMKLIMKIDGAESLERMLWLVCESHELSEMHLRIDERRCLNSLNRNSAATSIRFPMKGKITTKQMKVNCIIQASLGCLHISEPALNQESLKIMKIADRICKCIVSYMTRSNLINQQPKFYNAILNAILLAKCVSANIWENSPYVSKQLRGIGPTFSTLLATAGKVNFMLLEESHPRDLERIMNKGPPAGNILRKQISLLPKYQLTMNPIDEKSVTIQLQLLNQSNLKENIESLTASAKHKSYVIIGDSENYILLFTSFVDNNLINLYDGTITYTITRKHPFEHKIFAHCISANFVGIDAQCEYNFNNLYSVNIPCKDSNLSKTNENVRTSKDTLSESKKVTQSKEKVKRSSALLEKINSLKESFSCAPKGKKNHNVKPRQETNDLLIHKQQHNQKVKITGTIQKQIIDICDDVFDSDILEDRDMVDLVKNFDEKDEIEPEIDDHKIDGIISNIENEISRKRNQDSHLPVIHMIPQNDSTRHEHQSLTKKYTRNNPSYMTSQNRKLQKKLDNYSFIDIIEKNAESDVDKVSIGNSSVISESIRKDIVNFLNPVEEDSSKKDDDGNILISDSCDSCVEPDTETDITNMLTQKLYSEIVDIINIGEVEHSNLNNASTYQANGNYSCNYNQKHTDSEIANISNTAALTEVHLTNDEPKQATLSTLLPKIEQVAWANQIHDTLFKSKNTPSYEPIVLDANQLQNISIQEMHRDLNSQEIEKTINTYSCEVLQATNIIRPLEAISDVPQSTHEIKEFNTLENSVQNSQQVNPVNDNYGELLKANTRTFKYHPQISTDLPQFIDQKKDVHVVEKSIQNSSYGSQNIQELQETFPVSNCSWECLPENIHPSDAISHVPQLTHKIKKLNVLRNKDQNSEQENLVIDNCEESLKTKSSRSFKNPSKNIIQPHLDIPGHAEQLTDQNKDLHMMEKKMLNSSYENQIKNIQETKVTHVTQITDQNKDKYNLEYKVPIPTLELATSRDIPMTRNRYPDSNNFHSGTNRTHEQSPNYKDTKKFTYTTTQVDVWTKETNNEQCTMQVVKKLKLDLDITTIIRKEKTNQVEKDREISTSTYVVPCDVTTNSVYNGLLSHRNNYLKNELQEDTKEIEYPKKNIRSNDEETTNSVEDILQKYSRKLKQNKESTLPQTNTETSKTLKPISKTRKRPFKITDIDCIDISLPITLFDIPSTATSMSEKDNQQNYLHISQEKLSESEHDMVELRPTLTKAECFYDTNVNLTPTLDDDITISDDIIPSEATDVDQSLLDPKAFLKQCVNTDNQIDLIPPPLEFGDSEKYTPTNYNLDETLNENNGPNNSITNFNYDFTYEDAIQDHSLDQNFDQFYNDTGNTETWTLQNQEPQQTIMSTMANEIFVLKRGSPAHLASTSLINNKYITNSKQKLDQFKLNTKQKFKFRRN